jgi:hypothetical protein
MAEIRRLVTEAAPLLEGVLRHEEAPRYDIDLQLRGTVCGLATAALQLYMQERHGVVLERRQTTPDSAPRGLNSRRLSHVALFDDDSLIDPSYGQFYTYVGLSQAAAQEQRELRRLYPADKIAIVPQQRAAAFADKTARHMQAVEPQAMRLRRPDSPAYPPDKSLVGTSLEDKRRVLRDIWNPNAYKPFPVEAQSSSFQRRALRLAEHMHRLERH